VTESYSLREATELLGLSRHVIAGFIEAGFVSPERGARREYRFSFRDLVMLRAARGLVDAHLTNRRILRSLRKLRGHVPDGPPAEGLRIEAVGDSIVVTRGSDRWVADSGQYLLAFEVSASGERLAFASRAAQPLASFDDFFIHAVGSEEHDPAAAEDAYRRAIAADPLRACAYSNFGRLLHERGRLDEARAVYRTGIVRCAADSTLIFNLAVLEEDSGYHEHAKNLYTQAIALDPHFADAHYNLGLLCDREGDRKSALRHLNRYRQLRRQSRDS
jgi:tetratricopeptide (TPR) repeat protein